MKYRICRRTGDRISEIGLGSAYLYEAGMEEGVKALHAAFDNGINYYDLAAGDGTSFPIYGEAFHGIRDRVMFQIHFGADYSNITYGWTLDLDTVKRSVDRQLSELRTDYIDYGFIHCQDEHSDWETYQGNGILDYILELRDAGVIHHIGLSSHTPSVIHSILDTGIVDMLMFSVNPGYDYQQGEYAYGEVDERSSVYLRCQKEDIGISVMKPFSGGQLLDAKTSPFGTALTTYQCIRYALDKPGVLTVLPGVRNKEDVLALLDYYKQPETELDYSVIGTFAPQAAEGKCVYCNHCKPCPQGIDIGLVNKYYDLSCAGDLLAAQHYQALEIKASECISCGHCDKRCPFNVKQSERMRQINDYFSN